MLQEILHRYAAIDKREAMGPAFQVVWEVVDEVFGIEKADVLRAGEIAQNPTGLSCSKKLSTEMAPLPQPISNRVRHEHREAAGNSACLSGRAGSHGVLPKPSIEFFEPHSACLVEVRQERERVQVVELQPIAVDSQERCCHGHREAFVSIHERMVLREALPQSGRFLNRVAVVSAAGPSRSRLQGRAINLA